MGNINADIKSGQLKHVYLIYGEEAYLRHQMTHNLIKAFGMDANDMNFTVYKGDAKADALNAQDVANTIQTVPFLSEKRLTVIYDSEFCATSNDIMADCIKHIPDTSYVIFCETHVKKTTATFKAIQKADGLVECNMPSERDLQLWIVNRVKSYGKNMTNAAWSVFSESTYSNKDLRNMEYMNNEIEKIISYCWDKDTITDEDVRAIISPTYQDHIFDMINAIGNKDSATVIRLYEELLVAKVPPMMIMSNIIRQFKHLLALDEMLDDGYNPGQAAKELNLYPFVVQKYLKMGMLKKFSSDEIKQVLDDAASTITDIRSGKMDEKIGVELLMMKYSK